MESGINKKVKVVWICHFSNKEVRQHLPLSNLFLRNSIRKLLGKPETNYYTDFAPWISNLIKEFERFNDVELHVISPHIGLKNFTFELEKQGVKYHFFRPELPFLADRIFERFYSRKSRKYQLNRFFVKRFIKIINPDIVNLIGTENPYYSITTLDIKNIPVFVSVQTVYTNPNRLNLTGSCIKLNWDIELRIHQKEKYFGCGGRMHYDLILKNNPNAIIFKNFFPIQKPSEIAEVLKEYDFVFFAAEVEMKKGIEDALDAIAIVKQSKPDVTINVVGGCEKNYKNVLSIKINKLGLKDNVTFNDYFPEHKNMYQKSKICCFAY
jgi:glycosyltransferase involved in cell wall biosynthesis